MTNGIDFTQSEERMAGSLTTAELPTAVIAEYSQLVSVADDPEDGWMMTCFASLAQTRGRKENSIRANVAQIESSLIIPSNTFGFLRFLQRLEP